jgi:hypothetical protein
LQVAAGADGAECAAHLAKQALASVTPVVEQAVSVKGGEQLQSLKAGTRAVGTRHTPG